LELKLGYLIIWVVYLSPYSTKVREKELRALEGRAQTLAGRPLVILGDFNTAPEAHDGVSGGTESKWTSPDERAAFHALCKRAFLVDTTSVALSGKQEFSISRTIRSRAVSFRCDLALVSALIAEATKVEYDHSVRGGRMNLSDHSALVVDLPLSPEVTDLFTEAAADISDSDPGPGLCSHKTAIRRTHESRIARLLDVGGFLERWGVRRILDFGCGVGQDVGFFRSKGYICDGYDIHEPFGWSDRPKGPYDLVTVIFVLNVLPDSWSRLTTMRAASRYVGRGGYLFVATRSKETIEAAAARGGWAPYNDGYWSHRSRKTFQKGLTSRELDLMLRIIGLSPTATDFSSGSDVSCVVAKRDRV
jgi:hypothetical protein